MNQIEDFYSFYTEDKIKAFNKRFMMITYSVRSTEYYKSYLNIIKKCAKLFHELNAIDPLRASVLFEYLLWNGYFSIDKTLLYSFTRKNIKGFYAADIMFGKAVCINFSSMLASLMNELGIEAYIIGCYLDTQGTTSIYKPSIDKKRDKNNKTLNIRKDRDTSFLPSKERANHAMVIYRNRNGFSYSDVTNLMFLDNIGPLKARVVGGNDSFFIKPYVLLLENIITYESFVELFDEIFKSVNNSYMDVNEMIEFSEEVMSLCSNSINLFNDFYDDIHKDILGVCRILKS